MRGSSKRCQGKATTVLFLCCLSADLIDFLEHIKEQTSAEDWVFIGTASLRDLRVRILPEPVLKLIILCAQKVKHFFDAVPLREFHMMLEVLLTLCLVHTLLGIQVLCLIKIVPEIFFVIDSKLESLFVGLDQLTA